MVFRNTRVVLEDDEADCGFVDCGYLILGGDGGTADKLLANLTRRAGEGAETLVIPREEARARHPLLTLEDVAAIGYEPRSGHADPSLTTMSFLKAARRLTGALLDRLTHPVHILEMNGESYRRKQSRSERKKAR